ncbi:uncharacterized protein L3040_005433 [Drepanopeziza brunnea f. sp. 'multigermtubi']|nr:hypothetical protein L3040_005433 [Drepanopeziza brunnea f. sp. 'multigermtubi']
MSNLSMFLVDILGDMIFLPLTKRLFWVVPGVPTVLGYLLFNVISTILGMSAVMVLGYFLFPAVDDGVDLMRDVFWLRGSETWERFKRSAHIVARHLLLSRCVHMETGCDCFRHLMPLAELERLIDEAPAREPERELEAALTTINDTRTANTVLTAERDAWERRARDAEDQRRVCILEHQNYGRYQEANAHYRQRNSGLIREMADLRRRYNRERNERGLGPMFDEQPENLAEVNADLLRQISGLHDQLSGAGLGREPMSAAERTNARLHTDELEHRITRYVQQIEELEMRVAEVERQRSLTDDEEKASLRQRLTDVRNELRVVKSDMVEEELRRRKAEGELARLRDNVEAGGGDMDSDPPRRCDRCNTFRKDRNEQREIVTELRAQLAAAVQKTIDDTAILRTAVERLRRASRDVDGLPGSEESGLGDKGSPSTGREGIQLRRGRRKNAPEPTVTKDKDSMAPGPPRTSRSPSVASPTESEKSSGTSPVISENPIFWRIADRKCIEMFRRIQGYQKGLIKHGIDLSKSQQGGKNLELTVETIDSLRPSEAEAALTEFPILKKQRATLRAQLQALEAVWAAGQRWPKRARLGHGRIRNITHRSEY